MEIVDKIKEELKAFEDKRKVLVEELRKDFPKMFQPLFEKSKKINSISWSQYTPYFNDGDECTFGANTDYLTVNSCYEEDDEEELEFLKIGIYDIITEENLQLHKDFNSTSDGYSWYKDKKVGENGYFPNPNQDKNEVEVFKSFKEILGSIPEDFYKDLFGDHCQVTINRDGTITVEEYEHD